MAASIHDNDLRRCCKEIMELHADPHSDLRKRYPRGMDSNDILVEIRELHGLDAFSLCSILDVHDEMTALYGDPR